MPIRRSFASAVVAAFALAGCGGGGGGGGVIATIGGTDSAPLGGGTTPSGLGGSISTGTGSGTASATTGGATSTPTAQSAAFQVNTTAAGVQNSPDVAALADGGYVIAWHTDDDQGNGIFLRRFAADGTVIGGEVRIDAPVPGRFVSVAKVTGLEGGGYAVTWQSRTSDFDQWALHLRHVRADGTFSAVRDDFVRWFRTYELVSLAGGGYARLVQGPVDEPAGELQVSMQRYAADDTLLDTQQVEMGPVLQNSVHAVRLADGRRLLAWVRNDEARGGTIGLFFRFMAADGTLEATTHAGGAIASSTYQPAALRDGGFVVAGVEPTGGNTGVAVWVQRFANDGTAAGSRIRVDDEADVASLGPACTMSDRGGVRPCPFPWQTNPSVAGTDEGGFVVAWDTPDRQRPGRFVYARKFDAAGNAMGAPSAVDAAAPEQNLPALADTGQGFVAAWIGRDSDQSGIFARHYRSGELR